MPGHLGLVSVVVVRAMSLNGGTSGPGRARPGVHLGGPNRLNRSMARYTLTRNLDSSLGGQF